MKKLYSFCTFLLLLFFAYSTKVNACSPLGIPFVATQSISGGNFNVVWTSTTPWNCSYWIRMEIVDNSQAFTGIPNYISVCISKPSAANMNYPLWSIPLSAFCLGGTYKFRAMEAACGDNSGFGSGWSTTYTFTIPVSSPPTITQNDTVLTSSVASTYQWYLDGNLLVGETNQNITLLNNGSYTVIVTDTNGCYSESEPYIVTGINTIIHSQKVKLYPNPTDKQLYIIFDNEVIGKNISYTILDALGESIITKNSSTNGDQHVIPVDYLPSGIFYLNVFGETVSFSSKFIVQH